MNKQNENNELMCLQMLLNKWKLPHLLHHFIAQKIDVEILKIMKFHHIDDALKSFTVGDRIRFEYELEKWRQKIGIPLQDISKISSTNDLVKNSKNLNENEQMIEEINKSKDDDSDRESQATIEVEQLKLKEGNSSTTTTPLLKKPAIQQDSISKSLRSCKTTTTPTTITNTIDQNIPKQTDIQIPMRSSFKEPTQVTFVPSKELIKKKTLPPSMDARAILMQCLPRGPQLIKIYETRHCFSHNERVEIIDIIAKYFYQNSIHLSLKMSHVLENQILKMFPGERLKDYRTEKKRGRIYIRLGNIKNFKQRSARKKIRQQHARKQFVITSLPDNDDENDRDRDRECEHEQEHEMKQMIYDGEVAIDEVGNFDESNSVDHFLSVHLKNVDTADDRMITNNADKFEYTEIKIEDNGFEAET